MIDFSPKTLRSLEQKGIRVLHSVAIPDSSSPMPFANAMRGYALDDNGTHRIRSFAEVLQIAAAK